MARPKKIIPKEAVERAMKVTLSNRAAARYLNCSFEHYKKYAKLYKDQETGKSLYELHKNQSGRGIPKQLTNKGKEPVLGLLLQNKIPIEHYSPAKIKARLIHEGYIEEKCHHCGFSERRVVDYRVPLLLHFKDNNKKNYTLENLELVCYNCYFLYVGDVLTERQARGIEDYITDIDESEYEWELDEYHLERLKDLNLDIDDEDDSFIATL